MNNKKKWMFGLISLSAITLISFVTAQTFFNAGQGSYDLMNLIRDFLGPIFEVLLGESQFNQYFFARVLLLILVYIITSISISSAEIFKGKKGVIMIISAVVAILGARYIGELNIIKSILLPYGAFAIAAVVIFPVILYGFFIHKTIQSGLGRRTAWIFFMIIFFGLWFTRRGDPQLAEFSWIYNIGFVAVLATVAFDSKLHEYFGLVEAAEYKRGVVKRQIADVEERLARYAGIQNPSRTTRDVIRELEERRDELSRKL